MSQNKELNKQKAQRIIDIVPAIFSSGYLSEEAVLTGGLALNLEFAKRRFSTDIDLACLNGKELSFDKRIGYFADELRGVAQRNGYGFMIRIGKSSKAKLTYINHLGEEDAIGVDIYVSPNHHYLDPQEKEYSEIGLIRVMQLEEMLGGKISMLSRPRLRGHKRFSDLLDVYNSTFSENIDGELLQEMFVNYMTQLGIKVTQDKLAQMVDWHNFEKFQRGIEPKTEQQITFSNLRERILTHYRNLCDLTPTQREEYSSSNLL